jgi:predicted nucleic acid-binding protein
MRQIVADASVIVKWMLPERDDEADIEQALTLLEQVKFGNVTLHQPPHWLAEVAGVLSRLSPATVLDDVADLYDMGCDVLATPDVYFTACELARDLNHHLFDTLYHAVALNLPDGVMVTADRQYYEKARKKGRIVLLEGLALE